MKCNHIFLMTAALAFSAASLIAQVQREVHMKTRVAAPVAGRAGVFVGGANNFEFIAAGPAFGGEVVKNAPYSAEAVTESQQTLADGNKISRTTSTMLYRDSQGRTRTEQKLGAIGPWAAAGDPPEMIFINDPVAGVQYVLNARERTARKFEAPAMETISGEIDAVDPAHDVLQWKSATPAGGQAAQFIYRRERREVNQEAGTEQQDVTVAMPAPPPFTTAISSDDNARTESLGTQMIEGVEATGTRTIITIPAGQIGNDREIEIVSETWQSQQLQTLVLSKHSDPRMGETTYRLTNVQLIDPLPALFEVPADYTIEKPTVQTFERKLMPAGATNPAPAH